MEKDTLVRYVPEGRRVAKTWICVPIGKNNA